MDSLSTDPARRDRWLEGIGAATARVAAEGASVIVKLRSADDDANRVSAGKSKAATRLEQRGVSASTDLITMRSISR